MGVLWTLTAEHWHVGHGEFEGQITVLDSMLCYLLCHLNGPSAQETTATEKIVFPIRVSLGPQQWGSNKSQNQHGKAIIGIFKKKPVSGFKVIANVCT